MNTTTIQTNKDLSFKPQKRTLAGTYRTQAQILHNGAVRCLDSLLGMCTVDIMPTLIDRMQNHTFVVPYKPRTLMVLTGITKKGNSWLCEFKRSKGGVATFAVNELHLTDIIQLIEVVEPLIVVVKPTNEFKS